jgi:stage V sporulation protein SpoVS
MPQTFSQKYSEDLGLQPSIEYDEWISAYYADAVESPQYSPRQFRETVIRTVKEDRHNAICKGKGKGNGKATGKGRSPATSAACSPTYYSSYSQSTFSGSTYSTSASSDSTGARERAAPGWENWDEVADDLREWDEPRVPPFKVSASSDVRIVAGAIANTARRGTHDLVISACGAASINQAVKAIAVARGAYLKDDNIEIDVCDVHLADAPQFKHLVYMNIRFLRSRERPTIYEKTTHKVSGSSVAGKVAGAIASSLRDGVCCQVSVVGADAMLQAVLAISICAAYINIDPHPLALSFWPDFDTIYVDGERRTGISLYIISKRRLHTINERAKTQ